MLQIDPIVHSRWLILGCQILQYYVSFDTPPKKLNILAEFGIKVCFSSWLQIKTTNKVTGEANFFYI